MSEIHVSVLGNGLSNQQVHKGFEPAQATLMQTRNHGKCLQILDFKDLSWIFPFIPHQQYVLLMSYSRRNSLHMLWPEAYALNNGAKYILICPLRSLKIPW